MSCPPPTPTVPAWAGGGKRVAGPGPLVPRLWSEKKGAEARAHPPRRRRNARGLLAMSLGGVVGDAAVSVRGAEHALIGEGGLTGAVEDDGEEGEPDEVVGEIGVEDRPGEA